MFDYSPAIRTISRAELEGQVPLARRLEVWSVLLVPLWLAGVFGLSFRLALSWWLVTRMIGDPEPTLRRLQSIGTRLKVGDGEQKTISIRASPTPEGLVRFTP